MDWACRSASSCLRHGGWDGGWLVLKLALPHVHLALLHLAFDVLHLTLLKFDICCWTFHRISNCNHIATITTTRTILMANAQHQQEKPLNEYVHLLL
jgi:hypothetical protein